MYGHSVALQQDGDKIFLKVMTYDDPNAATLYEKIQPRPEKIQPRPEKIQPRPEKIQPRPEKIQLSAEAIRLKTDEYFTRYENFVTDAEAFSEKSTLSVCMNSFDLDRLRKLGEEIREIALLQLELGDSLFSSPSNIARFTPLITRFSIAQQNVSQKLEACASMVESVKEVAN